MMINFIGKKTMHFRSCILTFVGIAAAVIGIITPEIKHSMICLIISGVCDLFDGAAARKFTRSETQKEFGVQIDSLADVISFVALPISILIKLDIPFALCASLGVIYAIFSVIRLANFNVSVSKSNTNNGVKKYYNGLPMTYAALVFPVIYIITMYIDISIVNIFLPIAYMVCAIMFILDVKIRKPRGIAYVFFALLAVASVFFLLV